MNSRFFLPLLALGGMLHGSPATPAPFAEQKIGIPPLSLADVIAGSKGTTPRFEMPGDWLKGSGFVARPAAARRPTPTSSRAPRYGMPIIEPNKAVDYKVRVQPPNPSVDFKLIVTDPDAETKPAK
ncbi:MAG: hypothetical protein Q7S40_00690 [Opitutaceae bacterium]|nr:hypothetical protein [Opitutaceae bacterium]